MRRLIGLALGMAILAAPAAAFPEKDIDFIIPAGPGGGSDTLGRLFAPYLEKHLPGDHHVVPRNVTGAGGLRGTQTVFNADPNGHTVGLLPMPGIALPEALGQDTGFEMKKMSWVGSLGGDNFVLFVPSRTDIHSIEDLQAQDEVAFLTSGYGTNGHANSQIAAEVLELKNPSFLTGYAGSAEFIVGLVRGDGIAGMNPIGPGVKDFVEAGDLRVLAIAKEHDPDLPGVKTFGELGYPELDRFAIERWLATSPNTDPEALGILQDAFIKAATDPEFVEKALRIGVLVGKPKPGEELNNELSDNLTFYTEFKDILSQEQ